MFAPRSLRFIYPICKSDWIDQRLAMPNLVKPEIYDPFSTSLRLLSYQLRTMSIRVVADETLFWTADNSTSSWPNLKSINVMFHVATPSGTWHFQGLPNVGSTRYLRRIWHDDISFSVFFASSLCRNSCAHSNSLINPALPNTPALMTTTASTSGSKFSSPGNAIGAENPSI